MAALGLIRSLAGRRRGAETLEFLVTVVVLLIITAGCVMITNAFGNALAAQHALSQTSLYVAANGRYTQNIEARCIAMLPTGAGEASCRAYRVRGGTVLEELPASPNASSATPVPFGQQLRISVAYSQPFFELCAPSFTGNECVGDIALAIERHIDVPSLTREVR